MPTLPTDAELIAGVVARDDPRAFELLVRRYQAAVRGFLRHLAVDSSSADDLAQETFLKAYRRIAYFRGDSTFRTWLFSIALNELRQSHRGHTRRRKVSAALRAEPSTTDTGSEHDVLDLPKLLGMLEEEERTVLVLSHAHECSHREIALVTGLPLGTVKSHASRAKAKILARLQQLEKQHA